MDNNDFYFGDNEAVEVKKESLFKNKKIIVVSIVLFVCIIGFLIVSHVLKGDNYALNIESPSIIYLGEPIGIEVKLNGSDKYLDEAETVAFAEDDEIVDVDADGFYGEKGVIRVEPLSTGKSKIIFSTSVGADKYSKELANKTIDITVCPKLDESLIKQKQLVIRRGITQNLNIDFGDKECSSIITYESSNSRIVSVDENGNIKGLNSGLASVVVSNGLDKISVLAQVID